MPAFLSSAGGRARTPSNRRPAAQTTAVTTRTREAQMSKFGAGERVRSDNSPVSGIGTVIAWDDPRCLFAADDWKAHTAVAWDDETVTIVADEALSSAADVDWD